MPLTDSTARNAKPKSKPYKLSDGGGLYLLVNPNGSKLWRQKYRVAGKEKLLAHGSYDEISLKQAREARDDARRLLARDIDPSAIKQDETIAANNTLAAVAKEYISLREDKLSPITMAKMQWQLREFILPVLGNRPIAEIKASELLTVLRRLEARGKLETARKTKELCGRIFRFAIATARAERDPTADLRGALKPPVVRSHAAITEPRKVGELLRAIDGYVGQPATAAALKLIPHVFLRPGELRTAQWSEIDLDAAQWRIPAAKTKMRREHLVPLSRQAVSILRDIHMLTGNGEIVFPAIGPRKRPLSDNTLNGALRRLGYSNNEMVAHGFRALASTMLNELGFPPDVIELQLAHKDKDQVRAVYNRAQRLPERIKLMQKWSDHLDKLRAGYVVSAKRKTG